LAHRILLVILLEQLLTIPSQADQLRFLEQGRPIQRSSEGGYLQETPTRYVIDLNGPWSYDINGSEQGSVTIPAAFEFTGSVTFERSWEITPLHLESRLFHLVMYGSNYETEIHVNGEFLTNHVGGHTSFLQNIPESILQPGSANTIRVLVSNRLDQRSTLPLRPLVWGGRNYGGIHREVYVLSTPLLYVKDAAVETYVADDLSSSRVVVRTTIEGSPQKVPELNPESKAIPGVVCEVLERVTGAPVGKSPVVPLTRRGDHWEAITTEVVVPSPRLWSPDSPDMYVARVFLVAVAGKATTTIDEYPVPFGIRSLAVRTGDLLLNGKRLVLKGISWYEDYPGRGSSIPPEDRERDIIAIRNLGANTVRFIGHPPHPRMLELCDRHGLLALIELPLVHAPKDVLLSEQYQDLATGMLREMVQRDRNHPSVLAWGLADDCETSSTELRPLFENLVALVRSLDARPTYLATRLTTTDSVADLVDIAGINVPDVDLKLFRQRLESWRVRHRHQVLLVTRFGKEVQHENKNGTNDPFSQQAQARSFIQRFEVIRQLDYDGAVVWSFNDWLGERPALTVHSGNPWYHSMGLVNRLREKRLAHDAVRAVFRGEKYAALPQGTHSSGAPIVYVIAGFIGLLSSVYLYNSSRRFREHLGRSVLSSYNFFADVRDHHVVPFVHSTLLGLLVAIGTSTVISSVLFHYRDSLLLDNILSYVFVFDGLKALAVQLIWDPLRSLLILTPLVFFALVLLGGVVHALRLVVRTRVYAYHAYTLVMWSASPLLAFLPIGMIVFRIMEGALYILPSLVLIGLFFLWIILRIIKGTSIIYDVYPPKAFLAGTLVLCGIAGLLYLYYDLVHSAPMYLTFLYSMMKAGG
jgi:beta-glucuronidase